MPLCEPALRQADLCGWAPWAGPAAGHERVQRCRLALSLQLHAAPAGQDAAGGQRPARTSSACSAFTQLAASRTPPHVAAVTSSVLSWASLHRQPEQDRPCPDWWRLCAAGSGRAARCPGQGCVRGQGRTSCSLPGPGCGVQGGERQQAGHSPCILGRACPGAPTGTEQSRCHVKRLACSACGEPSMCSVDSLTRSTRCTPGQLGGRGPHVGLRRQHRPRICQVGLHEARVLDGLMREPAPQPVPLGSRQASWSMLQRAQQRAPAGWMACDPAGSSGCAVLDQLLGSGQCRATRAAPWAASACMVLTRAQLRCSRDSRRPWVSGGGMSSAAPVQTDSQQAA